MQAQKAFDSPRRANRGAVADLRDRLNNCWPKGRTALPPKREIILTPLIATYKGRCEPRKDSQYSFMPLLRTTERPCATGPAPPVVASLGLTTNQGCHSERTGPRTFFSSGVVSEESAVVLSVILQRTLETDHLLRLRRKLRQHLRLPVRLKHNPQAALLAFKDLRPCNLLRLAANRVLHLQRPRAL